MSIQKTGIMFTLSQIIAFFIFTNAICFAENIKHDLAVNVPYERHNYREECRDLPMSVRRSTDKLNESNLKVFCSQFDDNQREKAMHLANQKDKSGNLIMTPNQAVEKVAKEGK